jgi:hypothetical protein
MTGHERGNQVCDEIYKTAMPRVLHLTDVFEFVIHGLDSRPFAQIYFVAGTHQGVFHVLFQSGYRMYSVYKQHLEQALGNISSVTERLSEEFFVKSFVLQQFTVIRVRV